MKFFVSAIFISVFSVSSVARADQKVEFSFHDGVIASGNPATDNIQYILIGSDKSAILDCCMSIVDWTASVYIYDGRDVRNSADTHTFNFLSRLDCRNIEKRVKDGTISAENPVIIRANWNEIESVE